MGFFGDSEPAENSEDTHGTLDKTDADSDPGLDEKNINNEDPDGSMDEAEPVQLEDNVIQEDADQGEADMRCVTGCSFFLSPKIQDNENLKCLLHDISTFRQALVPT